MIEKKALMALSKQIEYMKCCCGNEYQLEDFFEHVDECKGQVTIPSIPS